MNSQTTNEYMFFFRGSEWYKDLSAEELQTIMQQSRAWFERLLEQGKVKPGSALERTGAIVTGNNGRIVDGPFAESKEAVGGYMILQAGSLQEAIAIAKTNPGLKYGTIIEVRPVAGECPLNTSLREKTREAELAAA